MATRGAPEGLVVVGRFASPWGVKGWLSVVSFTEPVSNLLEYRPWQVRENATWVELPVDAVRPHRGGYIAHLVGVDDRDSAARLAGRDIAVSEALLPAPGADEYYWKDLVGSRVRNRAGERLGEVVRLFEAGSHDVMVIENDHGELLIPFAGRYVIDVDVAARDIVVDWEPSF